MKHILLLENDRGVVYLLSTLLENDGCYFSAMARVADAVQIPQKNEVDLLIADIVLSDGTALPPSMRQEAKHCLPFDDRQLAAYGPA